MKINRTSPFNYIIISSIDFYIYYFVFVNNQIKIKTAMVSFTLSSIFVVCYENVIFQSVLCILVYCIKPEIMKRSESERICEWFTSQKEKYL